jgi:hypothetical protein
MMHRRHILIIPDPKGTLDFIRAERGPDGIWFQSATPLWLPLLLPTALASVQGGADFTFSAHRNIPLGDPAFFALPSATGFSVKVVAPLGKPHAEDQWGAALYVSKTQPPAAAGEKFIAANGGLRRVLDAFFTPERIDGYRNDASRPFEELWIRHSLTIEQLSPEAYDCPAWQKDPAIALALMSKKAIMSASEYNALRNRERAKKAAVVEQAEEPSQVEAKAEPVVTPEQLREARNRKTKMAKATRSKVAADKADAIAAKAHAEKMVGRMQREGKFG